MSEYVAVDGMTLDIDSTHSATISVVSPSSTINKINAKGVYKDNTQVSVTNIISGPATTPDPGPVTGYLNASISEVKENGTLLLVDGDETGLLNAIPKIPGSPPTDYPITFKIYVDDPNQTKVKAK